MKKILFSVSIFLLILSIIIHYQLSTKPVETPFNYHEVSKSDLSKEARNWIENIDEKGIYNLNYKPQKKDEQFKTLVYFRNIEDGIILYETIQAEIRRDKDKLQVLFVTEAAANDSDAKGESIVYIKSIFLPSEIEFYLNGKRIDNKSVEFGGSPLK